MNDIIEHHGVKGQKWGVHKKRASTTNSSRGASKSKSTTTPSITRKVLNAISPRSKVQSAITTSLGLAVGASQYSALRVLGSDRITALSGSLVKGQLVQLGGNILSNAILDASRNDTIEHHGVKGQKWGVKRARTSSYHSPTTKETQKKWKSTYAHRESLSNKDLKAKVDRLRLENQLAQEVSKIPRTRLQKAGKAIAGVLKNTASQAAGNLLANGLTAGGKKASAQVINVIKKAKN